MKIRDGFVSNSSTSSFVVKTKPTEYDKVSHKEKDIFILSEEKIKLLKKYGFAPIRRDDPFNMDFRSPSNSTNDTLLGYLVTCNYEFIAEFLVANDIPFKASIHYDHHLYSYDPRDEFIYILHNFGLQHFRDPKCLKKDTTLKPFEKISKKEFLKNYNEKDSIEFMKGGI